ncbi:MAG: CDP-diacylglycerol--glycerol-3-phosphate 3-phosphatidyltransferase, partial [Oscillospiraceae bacterium]|nr:CDP-diacylglycerol--glycerol-3-phosphate 3-phosphatidyltransferase [Oscillospiraceae bacterium]
MNLANKLTMFRVIVVPFFVFFMCFSAIPYRFVISLVLFALASITDMIDGKVARKYNMVTDFGKFLDPLADKVLVAAALVCFVELGWTSAWVVFVILTREFLVSGIRLVAASSEKKVVIPANIWGKLKTAVTMVAMVGLLILVVLITD